MNFQARTHQPGSYLSIDDVSFDPSIDDVSSGLQRSSRSSLAGTSATSAADISTLSVTASHRYLSNDHDEDDDMGSVISVERDEADGQGSPTTLTEFAVVHRSRAGDGDVFILPPPFPTPTASSLPSPQTPSYPIPPIAAPEDTTPTTSLETPTYPAPPPLFSNSFQNVQHAEPKPQASIPPVRQQETKLETAAIQPSKSPDRVRIYVPFRDDSPSGVNGSNVSNGCASPADNNLSSLEDPNRVVIHIDRTADGETAISSRTPINVKKSSTKSPTKKGAKSKSASTTGSRL